MASEWTVRPLEDCMAELIDYRGKTPAKTSFGIPLITAKVVKDGRIEPPDEFIAVDDYETWMRRGIPEPGDVVITTEAPLGEVAQLGTERVALAQRLIALRGKSGLLDNRFLKFLMQSKDVQEQLRARASGTTVLGIKQSELRQVLLAFPPLNEQRAIAYILGSMDDRIELNRRMSETLETTARALFKSWFVDFDPTRSRAEGPTSELPLAIAKMFPSAWTDSPLGKIPFEWSVGSILEHAKLMSGGTPKTDREDYWNGGIPWASAKDVSQCPDALLVATERTITAQGLTESATQIIPARSTVIVARGATTGRMALLGREMAMNQTCYALVSTTDTPYALYCHLRHRIDDLLHAAHGSVFDTITTTTFANSQFILPPAKALRAFDKYVSPLFEQILNNIEASRTLAGLRDALLPKLISGELRVRDAGRMVEAAA